MKFEVDKMDIIQNSISKLAKQQSEQINNYIIKFLKDNGYRPKNTIKYIKSLNYRLKSKGLKLKVKIIDSGLIQEDMIYKSSIKVIPSIEKIEEFSSSEERLFAKQCYAQELLDILEE